MTGGLIEGTPLSMNLPTLRDGIPEVPVVPWTDI